MKRKPPEPETCLQLARRFFEMYPQTHSNETVSWTYLFCWGMYEMYVEGWWQE